MTGNLEYRIGQLEDGFKEMKADIKDIMTNHLPHIQLKVNTVSTKVTIFGSLILCGITALILLGLTS